MNFFAISFLLLIFYAQLHRPRPLLNSVISSKQNNQKFSLNLNYCCISSFSLPELISERVHKKSEMAGAYAALVSLIQTMDQIQSRPHLSFSFDENQIGSLRDIAHFFLEFIENNDSHGRSEEVKDLEIQIASAAHEAEDLLESRVADRIHAGSTLSPRYSSDLEKILKDQMYSIKKKVENMAKESRIKDEEPADFMVAAASSRSPQPAGKSIFFPPKRVYHSNVVGFDDYSSQLMDQLTSQQSSRLIIPILGMGGIGKTTLARHVYDQPLIKQHFDVRAWATISQEYDARDILLQLLSRGGESTGDTIDVLGEKLHKMLWGRRSLIVLDDMWNTEAWEEVKNYFPDNGNGSRIIITSRLSNVATNFSPSSLEMSLLDKETSWKLFCANIFGEEEDRPFELVEIGKKIVERCKGLPLVIVTIAGLLRNSSRTEKQWVEVAQDVKSFLDYGEEEILSILSLSYNHLPVHLKPCFLYMGNFPEGKEILVSTLIRSWVAEGFLRDNGNQSLEEIGEGYLQDLVERNLISIEKKGWNGRLSTCKIHDLLREVCLKVGEKEKLFCVLKHPAAASKCRSASCLICNMRRSLMDKDKSRLLRILPKFEVKLDEDAFYPDCIVPVFNHLNMRHAFCQLYWERSPESLPFDEQRTVPQIRSRLPYIRLPSSISLLWNLQTLVIHGVFARIVAPVEIWEMTQLRHLDIFDMLSLPVPTPVADGEDALVMQNMQTLLVVENFKLNDEVCRRIPNLKELQMYYDLEASSRPRSEFNQRNLGRFKRLESLRSEFDEESNWRDFALDFTFPSSLKELWLGGSGLRWPDLSMIGSLPNLEVLTLSCNSDRGKEWNSIEGEFLRLKSLTIYNCEDLVCWNVESCHFPVMKTLTLGHANELVEFPSEVGDIPTLEVVHLHRCSVSVAVSAMRMLKEQEEMGNEELRLEIQFKDSEELERFMEIERVQGLDCRCRNLYLLYSSIY